jgi:hypothetical protein
VAKRKPDLDKAYQVFAAAANEEIDHGLAVGWARIAVRPRASA